MKKSRIFLPIVLGLILVLIFVGSIFLSKKVENDINSVERVNVNYSEARLFEYILAPRGVKKTILVKLQDDGTFKIISGEDGLSEDEKETIINDVKKLATKYINKIEGNTVEVVTHGYAGKITITYDISDNKVKVLDIVQSESYSHNDGYNSDNGDPFALFKENINNGNPFDINISGATVSTNSIKENYNVLQDYLAYLGGK